MLLAFFAVVLAVGLVLIDVANRIAARTHPNYRWRPFRREPRPPLPRRYYVTVVAGGTMVGFGASYLANRVGLLAWIGGCVAVVVLAGIVRVVRDRSVRPHSRTS